MTTPPAAGPDRTPVRDGGRTPVWDPDRTTGPRVLLSSVSSDSHTWNLVFLQLLLEEHGCDVVNLGACVDDDLLLGECRRLGPDLLVISTVNGHGYLDGLRLIGRLRTDPLLAGLRVVIGGKLGVTPQTQDSHARELLEAGYDVVGGGGDDTGRLTRYLQGLRDLRVPALTGGASPP